MILKIILIIHFTISFFAFYQVIVCAKHYIEKLGMPVKNDSKSVKPSLGKEDCLFSFFGYVRSFLICCIPILNIGLTIAFIKLDNALLDDNIESEILKKVKEKMG